MFVQNLLDSLIFLAAGSPHHPDHGLLGQGEHSVPSAAQHSAAFLHLVEDGVEHGAEVHVDLLRPPVPGDQVQDLLGVEELRHRDDVALEAVQLAVGGSQVDQPLLLRNILFYSSSQQHQPTYLGPVLDLSKRKWFISRFEFI